MIKIGLTGGIGSGKTTVARMFEELGVPVYYADDKAKELMNKSPELRKKIKKLLGEQAYEGKQLNTKYVAGIVFEDKTKLSALEKLVHPVVVADFLSWAEKKKAPFVIMENAILHKSKMDRLMDYIIWVTADKEKRLKRVMKRDNTDRKSVEKRILNQLNETKMLKNADFIIKNNNFVDDLKGKVEKIFNKVNFKLKKC